MAFDENGTNDTPTTELAPSGSPSENAPEQPQVQISESSPEQPQEQATAVVPEPAQAPTLNAGERPRRGPTRNQETMTEDFATALESFEQEQAELAANEDRVLKGTVVSINPTHLVVDIGLKSEGVVSLEEVKDHD